MSRTFSSGVSIVFRKLHSCSHLIFSPTLLFSFRFILVQLWKSSLQPCLLLPTEYFYILPCWYLDRPIKPRQDIDAYLLELDTRFARKIFTRLFCFQTEISSMTSVNYLNETWLRMRQKQIVMRIPVTTSNIMLDSARDGVELDFYSYRNRQAVFKSPENSKSQSIFSARVGSYYLVSVVFNVRKTGLQTLEIGNWTFPCDVSTSSKKKILLRNSIYENYSVLSWCNTRFSWELVYVGMHRSKKEGMSSDSGNPILMGGQLRAVRIEFDIISLITRLSKYQFLQHIK